MPDMPPIDEASPSDLPPLLAAPPWTRGPHGRLPTGFKGLKPPKAATAESWPPGLREKWLAEDDDASDYEFLPGDADWTDVAEALRSGAALKEARGPARRGRAFALVMRGPDEFALDTLADERYWGDFEGWPFASALRSMVARRGAPAYPMVLHLAKKEQSAVAALSPFVDGAVAQLMIKGLGSWKSEEAARTWFAWHGRAAAPFVIPEALRKPGPKRELAERALLLIAREHGHEVLVESARHYGDEVVRAMEAFRTDPLDLYPDPLPEIPEALAPERLPQILLRGGRLALPPNATRAFLTMLLISSPEEPYAGVERVVPDLDPGSLAAFAWALYAAEERGATWASPGVQYALGRLGDDGTIARLAARIARWERSTVWYFKSWPAVDLVAAHGSETALRHLDRLARKAADAKWIRPAAQAHLDRIAKERGFSPEQLADRLVPDLGLDADGGLTLDYGHRSFRVGFDEQLKPFVRDADGKVRTTLPKPGAKDDPELAPAAHQRFTTLKKEAREIASGQIQRLERAMLTAREWTPDEFGSLFLGHPLLRHIARRLVWTSGSATFRVAEDGSLADVRDDVLRLTGDVRVPHPLHLGEELAAWSELFADYEILQPFAQLGRPVHALTDEERAGTRLTRFEGVSVPNGPLFGLERQGWEFGEKETGGYRRQISLKVAEDRHVVLYLEPGIRVLTPEDAPVQEIERVSLRKGRYGPETGTFADLTPVAASELLATLIRLAG